MVVVCVYIYVLMSTFDLSGCKGASGYGIHGK